MNLLGQHTRAKTTPDIQHASDLDLTSLHNSAREYLARKAVESEPQGSRDAEGIWMPGPDEEMECCKAILPTRDLSGLILHHCCTMKHVASLFGVSTHDVQAVIR